VVALSRKRNKNKTLNIFLIGSWFWFTALVSTGASFFYKIIMKIIYTILFFADTLILIVLAFLFLKLKDMGMNGATFIALIAAIIFCIALLVYFILHYLKLPPSGGQK
jgi:hypothetical protein